VVCYVGMEYEDQEQELEYGDGEIEWKIEKGDEPSEPGSHTSRSPDAKPFEIPDISADVAKGKAAKQQIGRLLYTLHSYLMFAFIRSCLFYNYKISFNGCIKINAFLV